MSDSPFEGRLIRLRGREPEDEPLLHRWINDPEVNEHLSIRFPISHRGELEFVESASNVDYNHLNLTVETLDGRRMIGGCNLDAFRPENRSAVLGIAIGDKEFWNGGYGTDTMRTLCRFGFEMMNLHRIQLDVFDGNDRARHVYEKIGFRTEVTKRQAVYKFGRYLDVYVMGLLEGELLEED